LQGFDASGVQVGEEAADEDAGEDAGEDDNDGDDDGDVGGGVDGDADVEVVAGPELGAADEVVLSDDGCLVSGATCGADAEEDVVRGSLPCLSISCRSGNDRCFCPCR
jgi:hypothetical protein